MGPLTSSLAAYGDVLAYGLCQDAITVRDFAPAAAVPSRAIPVKQPLAGISLAGRFLAFAPMSDPVPVGDHGVLYSYVALHDWKTGERLYRTEISPTAFAVDADGTLIVAQTTGDRCQCGALIVWYSSSGPQGRQVRVGHCTFLAGIADGRAVVTTERSGRWVLASISSAGGRREIADLGRPGTARGFDVAGARAAFGLRACDGRMDLMTVAVDSTPVRQPVACPVRLIAPTQLRGRRARVALICERRCSGRVRLVGRRRQRGQLRTVALSRRATFAFAPSSRVRHVRIPISRAARRRLTANLRARVTVEISATYRDGSTRVRRRTVRVTSSPS